MLEKGQGTDSSLEPPEGTGRADTWTEPLETYFGLPTSKTLKMNRVVLSHEMH